MKLTRCLKVLRTTTRIEYRLMLHEGTVNTYSIHKVDYVAHKIQRTIVSDVRAKEAVMLIWNDIEMGEQA